MVHLIAYFCKYLTINQSTYSWLSIYHNCLFFYDFRHVQVNNEGAIDFYKKFGFEIVETKEHYYKRIEPADAHVLQKTINFSINKKPTNTTVTLTTPFAASAIGGSGGGNGLTNTTTSTATTTSSSSATTTAAATVATTNNSHHHNHNNTQMNGIDKIQTNFHHNKSKA